MKPQSLSELADNLSALPKPGKRQRFVVSFVLFIVILAWSFQGAKIRPGELLAGIPEIGETIRRMMPPDFSKVTSSASYYFPSALTTTQLLLPTPLSESQARIKQRWWDNTFPQTIVGATLETVQMAFAGTFLAFRTVRERQLAPGAAA